MSDLNLKWVQENFSNRPIAFFNIGCADITDDTFRFSVAMPNATIYSFECSDQWKQSNIEKASQFELHYEHKAVSYFDGESSFYNGIPPSSYEHDEWEYRGSLMNPILQKHSRGWNQQIVEVTTLNTICYSHNIIPNFLHIDIEMEEYNALINLNDEFFPEAIWSSYNSNYHFEQGKTVDFNVLDNFLCNKGYKNLYQNHLDILYVKDDQKVTNYYEYKHYKHHNNVPMSCHEKEIQQKMWVKRYNCIKDQQWPLLSTPSEFFNLPNWIQDECVQIFNLLPSKDIC